MSLDFYKYSLPLVTPFRWGSQTIRNRTGILVRYQKNGIESWGEIAPLPGYSSYSISQVEQQMHRKLIRSVTDAIRQNATFNEWDNALGEYKLYPSLRFGLDSLYLHAAAQKKQVHTSEYLFGESSHQIKLNVTLGLQSPSSFLDKADLYFQQGFRTFKCKVGSNFEQEFSLLQQLQNQYPQIKIRLDVNGGWSIGEAQRNLEKLASLNIQYCEQPLPADQWSELKELEKISAISIAPDESISDLEDFEHFVKEKEFEFLVIKPMKLGSIKQIISIGQQAVENGITLIFSSLIDSGIARLMYAILASGVSNEEIAHGLATGHVFKQDLLNLDDFMNGENFILPGSFADEEKLFEDINHAYLTPLNHNLI